jgi:hypothetical protein
MRWILGLLISLTAAAAHAQAADPYQLVGFSTNSVFGDEGVIEMGIECQADFGWGARMCASTEVMETVVFPQGLAGDAWIQPAYKGFGFGGSGSSYRVLEASGRVNSSGMNCNGWTGTTGTGLSVSNVGGFSEAGCAIARPVACCQPIPISEPPTSMLQGTGVAALALLAALGKN